MLKKIRISILVAFVGLAACITGCVSAQSNAVGPAESSSSVADIALREDDISFPENGNGALTVFTLGDDFEYIQSNDTAKAASIVRYKADQFLIAYYDKLSLLDWSSGEQTEIIPSGLENCEVLGTVDEQLAMDEKPWNPTGLYYDKSSQQLYIANYNGHNILIGTITENYEFRVEKMIVAQGLVSPENVVVNEDGSCIAVADYDGNALFVFGNDGNVLWKKDVGLAHGVEIGDEYVYCTSLDTREVIQYDWDGNEVNRVGTLAKYGANAYMWPVALETYNGQLLVADAHSGRISLLDENLNFISSLGANGPYITNLNYPYALLVEEPFIYITDVFSQRILKVDFDGVIHTQLSKNEPSEMAYSNLEYTPHYLDDTAYLYEEQTSVPATFFNPLFSDFNIVGGFSSIWAMKDSEQYQIPLLKYESINTNFAFDLGEFYSTWCYKIKTNHYEYYLFGSPQCGSFIFYNEENRFGGLIFAYGGGYYCIDGIVYRASDLTPLDNEWLDRLDFYTESFSKRIKAGEPRLSAYLQTMLECYQDYDRGEISVGELAAWVSGQCSQSEKGSDLFTKIVEGSASKADLTEYFLQRYLTRNSQGSILENILFRTLLPEEYDVEMESVAFQVADEQSYYEDYPLENSLDGDPYDDYSAMMEGQSNSITIKTAEKSGVSVMALSFIWESDDNFATDYTISFKCDGQEVGSIEMTNQESALQYALINNITADEMTVTVRNFKGENRVLLRQIKAWEWK